MKSFNNFLVEFAQTQTSYFKTDKSEKFIAGGSVKSTEVVPLISLQDFYYMETRHGRLREKPSDKQLISEVYDPEMSAVKFDASTNYHGIPYFINEILIKLKNFETFVTTEDGTVIEKNIKNVIGDINGMIKSENGLKGHLRAYDKLSERTFKPKGENKSYQKFSTRIKSKYAKVFDSGIPSNILYDRVTGKVHSANLKELVRTFTEAYKIAVKTFDLATKKSLLHGSMLYNEKGMVDPEEIKQYLKGEKKITPGILGAFHQRSGKKLGDNEIQGLYKNMTAEFKRQLKKEMKENIDYEDMSRMGSLSTGVIQAAFGRKMDAEEIKEVKAKFSKAMDSTMNKLFGGQTKEQPEKIKLYMFSGSGKFKEIQINEFSKVMKAIHRSMLAQKDESGDAKDFFKKSAALGSNVKVQNTKDNTGDLDSNKKISKTGENVVDFTLPAYRGLVLMKRPWKDIYGNAHPANTLAVINTCPGAGLCKSFCYATKGGYVMFNNPQLQAAKMLTKLVNEPLKFKKDMVAAIQNQSKNKKLYIRWHDAGDFFTSSYFNLVMDIAKKTPNVLHYAYTKRADLLAKSMSGEISSIPSNFIFDISKGSIFDKSISKTLIANGMKYSDVLPMKFPKKKLTPAIVAASKNKENVRVTEEDVIYDFPSKDELKAMKGEKDDVYKDLLEAYIKAITHVYDLKHPVKTYDQMTKIKENSQGKFHVLVQGNDGDASAFRKDCIGTLLVIH